ncbi:hypothetical protein I7I50_09704 [Histoplasma capsulatum G186AR]|uniref:Uncharacterized protein n=1 Tax=Ajellomyces capsulatus TaxID=5037 RepID=A0A8H7YSK8_AJECA|nr:hypothetical protein I7I52_07234 [Histoplasma capsulatum]QSS74494.1 hypothetical protein I7I50_09704 [Histoplasma capsulatum G186AR]
MLMKYYHLMKLSCIPESCIPCQCNSQQPCAGHSYMLSPHTGDQFNQREAVPCENITRTSASPRIHHAYYLMIKGKTK